MPTDRLQRISKFCASFGLSALVVTFGGCAPGAAQGGAVGTQQWSGEPYTQNVPATTVGIEMVPVPAGTVEVDTPDGTTEVAVGPFYMSRLEIPWDVFDVWVLALDEGSQVATGKGEEAVSRPSRPYVLPGRNWGHAGMPALAMTPHAATVFAAWLSEATGHTYRLPTRAEWIHACRAGGSPGDLDAVAWYFQNSNDRTHPGGQKDANAFGISDMLGNVGEWVTVEGGEPLLMGGSFADPAGRVACDAGQAQTPAWNASDPQLPKSEWWLVDAPFAGIRLVREP